jgi:cysteine synthase
MPINIEERFRDAILHYWSACQKQQVKQVEGGKIDAGTRGAVTGGTRTGTLEVLDVISPVKVIYFQTE